MYTGKSENYIRSKLLCKEIKGLEGREQRVCCTVVCCDLRSALLSGHHTLWLQVHRGAPLLQSGALLGLCRLTAQPFLVWDGMDLFRGLPSRC